jgi:hypothetical protein
MLPNTSAAHRFLLRITARLEALRETWLRPHISLADEEPGQAWLKMRLLLVIVAFGHLIAAAYYYWNSVYLGRGYPYNSYLNLPEVHFTDYDNMILMCRNLNPYHEGSRSGYPPLANLLYYLFSPYSMRFGYFLFVIPPVIFLAWISKRILGGFSSLQQWLTLIFVLLFSYPFLFTFDRGNLEFYLMISTGGFLVWYDAKGAALRNASCFCLAAAIALKIYPALFLLLFVKDRRFLDLLKVLIVCEALTVGSALTFSGGASAAFSDYLGMLHETDRFVKDQIVLAHGNSGIFYGVLVFLKSIGCDSAAAWFSANYWAIAIGLLASYSFLIVRMRLTLWAAAIAVVCLMCLIPTLSNDYRTLQLLVPMLLFVGARTAGARGGTLITVLLGLLLIPRNYWILLPDIWPGDIGIGSIITPVILFALLNAALLSEWGTARSGAARSGQRSSGQMVLRGNAA